MADFETLIAEVRDMQKNEGTNGDPAVTDQLSEVLAEHRHIRGTRDHKAHCACKWASADLGETRLRHEGHVAAELATLVAAAQASALREAADEMTRLKALGAMPSGQITDEQRAEFWAFEETTGPAWLEARAEQMEGK